MPEQNLLQRRVLVTRPAHQSANLCTLLQQQGAEPVALPLLSIKAIGTDDPQFHTLKQKFLDLDHYQHIIFISPNAVQLGYDWIDQYWPQLPLGIQWYGIGRQSSALLNNYGIDAYHSPLGYDSEALLQAPSLQQVAGEKILIMRGTGGREKLAEELRARGAEVSYAELYRRECPAYSRGELEQALLAPPLDAILISSGAGLENLLQLIAGLGEQFSTDSLFNCHLIVPSERTRHDAEAAGFTRITTAAGPDDQSMIQALLQ